MTPASTTASPASASSRRTRFMRLSDRIVALPSAGGVAPPTIELLPPCGTSGTPCARAARTTCCTCALSSGASSSVARPW